MKYETATVMVDRLLSEASTKTAIVVAASAEGVENTIELLDGYTARTKPPDERDIFGALERRQDRAVAGILRLIAEALERGQP